MPIHEYACDKCKKILSFFIRNPAAEKQPVCPHCGNTDLTRRMSTFAVVSSHKTSDAAPGGAAGDDSGDDMSPAQAKKLEQLMKKMEKNIDKIDENDPRQIGRFLREFGDATGEDLGPEFNEAVGRLEAGEDPEKVEEQLSEVFGDEGEEGGMGGGGPYGPGGYSRDSQLYDL